LNDAELEELLGLPSYFSRLVLYFLKQQKIIEQQIEENAAEIMMAIGPNCDQIA